MSARLREQPSGSAGSRVGLVLGPGLANLAVTAARPGRIADSLHLPLHQLPHRIDELPTGRAVVLYCAGGYRSLIGVSLLLRYGFTEVGDLVGGFTGWASSKCDAVPAS
jgi:rhodanese-related sulfurtransferase